MMISTPAYDFFKASPANLTGSFPVLSPQSDVLADDPGGVFELGGKFIDHDSGSIKAAPNALLIMLFGTGADNATFSARLTTYSKLEGGIWIPVHVFEVSCLLSQRTGQAGQNLLDTERLVDNITKVSGPSNMEIFSPANDAAGGHVLVDGLGGQYGKITVNLGTATGANAMIKKL